MVKGTDLQAGGREFEPQRSHIFFSFFPIVLYEHFCVGRERARLYLQFVYLWLSALYVSITYLRLTLSELKLTILKAFI